MTAITLAWAGAAFADPQIDQQVRADTPAYVAVIDAGSSGTRLAVYSPISRDQLTVMRIMKSSPNSPGLSSFAADPENAGPKAIDPLLQQLSAYLAKQGINASDVPVALLATAGMRLVREQDPLAASAILASTGQSLSASAHPVLANKILPGSKEALFAWVDANAQAGSLDEPAPNVGTAEIGGASAQVAFLSSKPRGPGVVKARVGGRTLPVVAVSYLGLGADQARDTMKSVTRGGLPCFPNNASGQNPEFYAVTSSRPVPSGQALFQPAACADANRTVIRRDMSSRSVPKDLWLRNLRDRPGFEESRFIGVATVAYTYQDLGLGGTAVPQSEFDRKLRETCAGADAWPRVLALYAGTSTAFADLLCSNGSYVKQFLFGRQGLGVDPERLDAAPDAVDPSWSEGYALTVLFP